MGSGRSFIEMLVYSIPKRAGLDVSLKGLAETAGLSLKDDFNTPEIKRDLYDFLTREGKDAPELLKLREEIFRDGKLARPEIDKVMHTLLEENGVKVGIPRDEMKHVLSDGKIGRGEAIGLLAAAGNSSNFLENVPLTRAEVDEMAERMAQFGLDRSKPEEARMIRGLARMEKGFGEVFLQMQEIQKIIGEPGKIPVEDPAFSGPAVKPSVLGPA